MRRRPPLWASIFTALAVCILCSLGIWQIQRLAWKTEILAAYDAALAMPASESPVLIPSETKDPFRFMRRKVTGTVLQDKTILLSPRTFNGVVGAHVLTPLRLQDGSILYVMRGWVPQGTLPDDIEKQDETHVFSGILKPPPKRSAFTPVNSPEQQAWYFADLSEIAATHALPTPLPAILYQDEYPEAPPIATGPVRPIAQPALERPNNNHRQYAAFWFGMAACLCVVFFLRFCRSENSPGIK